jgi:hypothetical protein
VSHIFPTARIHPASGLVHSDARSEEVSRAARLIEEGFIVLAEGRRVRTRARAGPRSRAGSTGWTSRGKSTSRERWCRCCRFWRASRGDRHHTRRRGPGMLPRSGSSERSPPGAFPERRESVCPPSRLPDAPRVRKAFHPDESLSGCGAASFQGIVPTQACRFGESPRLSKEGLSLWSGGVRFRRLPGDDMGFGKTIQVSPSKDFAEK